MQNAAGRCYPICNFNFNNFAYLELGPHPDQPEAANEGSKNITHNYSPQFDKRLSLSLSLSLSLKLLIV